MSRHRAPFVSTIFCKALVLALGLIVPGTSFAASLFVSPRSGSYAVGDTFSVGVIVEASDTAFNAVSGTLSFPVGTVEVVSLSKASSVISLWVQEPTFSNTAGTVSFEGIVLNPGYKGSNARILTVQFRAKKEGTAPLSFLSGEVLANDGIGTSIISTTGKASYTIATKAAVPIADAATEVVATKPVSDSETSVAPEVVSLTHKLDQWSNQTTGIFAFNFDDEVTALRLLIDGNADSIPTVVYQPPIKERSIDSLTEGSSYLHVQSKNTHGWGEITHYHLQIDSKQPESLEIVEIANAESKTFSFKATDHLSGVDRFEVSLDGSDVSVATATASSATYITPVLRGGRHLLSVKAFDKAGNFIQSSKEFTTTEQPAAPSSGSIFPAPQNILDFGKMAIIILSIVVPMLALIGLLLWLLFISWKLFGGFKRRLKEETEEAKSAVRKSFGLLLEDLGEDVKTLQKAGAKRTLTKEEIKVLKRLEKHIALTESFIYKEISDIEDEVENIPSLGRKKLPKKKDI